MYAVLVIAAVLLSVAPMHARTILAALPTGTPRHQFAPGRAGQPETRIRLQKATRHSARPVQATYPPATQAYAPATPAPSGIPHLPATALGLLEHAPNAP